MSNTGTKFASLGTSVTEPALLARMRWRVALKEYRQYMVGTGWSPATRAVRMEYAHQLAGFTTKPPGTITVSDLDRFLASHPEWKPATRKTVVACLRAFFAWMLRTGKRRDNPALLLASVRVSAGVPRPCPDPVLRLALSTADDRARLMLEAAAFCGLRRSEIARLHSDQLVRSVEGGWSIRLVGKGGKVRAVPCSDSMAQAISERSGWTFPGRTDGHLSPQSVGKLVKRALPDGWTTHTLRHRFASAAYRGERDILAVRELLGHASVSTTEIYTQVPDDARRRSAAAAWSIAAA